MGILQLTSRKIGASDIAFGLGAFSWVDENGISHTASEVNASQIPSTLGGSVDSVISTLDTLVDTRFAKVTYVTDAPYNAVGDGVTDDAAAFNAAFTALPANSILYIPRPSVSYALGSTLAIPKPLCLLGEGISHVTTASLAGANQGILFTWLGGASPMISVTSKVGVQFYNLALDGNAIATWGLYLDRLCQGGGQNLAIRNMATGGLWLGSTSAVLADNAAWNTFINLTIDDVPNMVTLDGFNHDSNTANACHNTFIQLRGTFTGTYGIDLQGADNNAFHDTYQYRSAGTGHGVRFAAGSANNYFYHLQGPVAIGGLKSAIVDAGCPGAVIYGYDMTNGQALPEITATGKLSYYSQGVNSFGDYPEKYNMAGDILYTTLNGEAMRWEDYTTGNNFKFLLNPVTRKVEFWADSSGSGYVKILEFGNNSLHVVSTDLTFDTVATSVVLKNAAGTLTKRARLNDTGDGWLFEDV